MDIFTIRQKLRSTRLSDIPLRVTFYARVSTDSDEQLNSLDNQIGYYRDYITRNPAWTFIDGYIDEGLSGMTTRKRDNFQRMVQDAKDDKFDLILTKEITRFARNTLDSIRYTRELLSAGVGPAEAVVQVEGDPGQVSKILQQGKQRKKDGHGRQHHRHHPGEYPPYPFYQGAGQPAGRP